MDSLHLAQWSYLDKYPSGSYILGSDGSTRHVPYVKTTVESEVAQNNTSQIIDSGTNLGVEEGFLVSNNRGRIEIYVLIMFIILSGFLFI